MDQERLTVSVTGSDFPRTEIEVDKNWREVVDEFTERSPYSSRSSAIRSLTILGMYTFVDDPRDEESSINSSDRSDAVTVREFIPEGRENAINMTEEVPQIIRENIIDIVEGDPEINRDGLEVWK